MKINNILIKNLRSHKNSYFEFSDGINVIYGLNGSGKTTILEAISLTSLTKSFLPVNDINLINYDEDYYSCILNATTELESPYKISVSYQKNKKKQINSTEGDNLNPKDVIGDLPVIILSPDFKSITFGGPSDRRQFIDKILSQSSKKYIENILKMKKSIKQRNSILLNNKKSGVLNELQLDTWTEVFTKTSSEVIVMRNKFLKNFLPYFLTYYKELSSSKEQVNIKYKPDHIPEDLLNDGIEPQEIQEHLNRTYNDLKDSEVKRGTSLFGPQKDEIVFEIDRGIAKDSASQGQHKSLLISIKFAEYEYLKDVKKETPIILLDDIFAELDKERSNKVLKILSENSAQTLITVTDENLIKNASDIDNINYIKMFN